MRAAGSVLRLWLQLWHRNLAQMNRERARRLILRGVRRGRRRRMPVVQIDDTRAFAPALPSSGGRVNRHVDILVQLLFVQPALVTRALGRLGYLDNFRDTFGREGAQGYVEQGGILVKEWSQVINGMYGEWQQTSRRATQCFAYSSTPPVSPITTSFTSRYECTPTE